MIAKRSVMNLIFGLVGQLVIVSLGILIPRLFLIYYGSETNGFVASITQITAYLVILEAGVGAASLQALYKYTSQVDKVSINEILSATSSYYKKTGIYYFICVILIAIIYPMFVKSSINASTIIMVILLTGLGGAFNYYFQGTYRVFLSSIGKNYVDTIITTIINILTSAARITLILAGFNILIVQGSFFLLTLFQILLFYVYIKKKYKWIDLNTNRNFKAISQKSSALVHQISYLIFNNTDVLILTLFTNLKIVSVYVIYNMLFSVLDRVLTMINSSLTFALGQTFFENKKKFIKMFDAYEVYYMAIVFTFFTVAYIFILPFMKLYTSGITDVNYIDPLLAVLFTIIKLLSNARSPSNNVINIAGHFKKTQYRSILEASINIIASLIFVFYFGMYGVLMGTIAALLYRSVDMIVYSNKRILNRNPWITIKRWLIDLLVFLIFISLLNQFSGYSKSYLSIILLAGLFFIITLSIFVIVNLSVEKSVFLFSRKILLNILEKKRSNQIPNKK